MKYSIGILKAPRIALTNQLQTTHQKYFEKRGLINKFNTTSFHSGEEADIFEEDDLKRINLGTMGEDEYNSKMEMERRTSKIFHSIEEIKKFVITAWMHNETPIFYTTYHSNLRLVKLLLESFDESAFCDINDEAHNLVRTDFTNILDEYTPKFQYHFTATEKITESDIGRGMNNVERFGKRIFNLTVKEAIRRGIILGVKPLQINNNVALTNKQTTNSIDTFVIDGLKQTKKEFPQSVQEMLISVREKKQIKKIINSPRINIG